MNARDCVNDTLGPAEANIDIAGPNAGFGRDKQPGS
jgi:hypothetical protein